MAKAAAKPETEKVEKTPKAPTKKVGKSSRDKKAPTAYNLFLKSNHASIVAKNGEAAKERGKIMKLVAEAWKNLSEAEKQPYIDQADQAKKGGRPKAAVEAE